MALTSNHPRVSSQGSLAKAGSLFSTGIEGVLRLENGIVSFYDRQKTKLLEMPVVDIQKVQFDFSYAMKIVTNQGSHIFRSAPLINTAEDYKNDWMHLIATLYELIPGANFPFSPDKQLDLNKRWATAFNTYNIPTHLTRFHSGTLEKIVMSVVLFFIALTLVVVIRSVID